MESAIRVDANIKLQIAVFSSTTVSLNVSYRERINGVTKQPREANIASSRITTSGAANYFYYQFYGDTDDVSELLNVAVGLATSGVQRGKCFVRVGLTIGGVDGSAKDAFQVLFSDYVTSNSVLAYPGTQVNSSLSGIGDLQPFELTAMFGGQYLEYALGSNFFGKIILVKGQLVTDANVANRLPYVYLTNSNPALSNLHIGISSLFQTASQTSLHNFGRSFNHYSLTPSTTIINTIPLAVDTFIAGGQNLRLAHYNLQAGDVWSSGVVLLEQFLKT